MAVYFVKSLLNQHSQHLERCFMATRAHRPEQPPDAYDRHLPITSSHAPLLLLLATSWRKTRQIRSCKGAEMLHEPPGGQTEDGEGMVEGLG